jgi:hypothetical protein
LLPEILKGKIVCRFPGLPLGDRAVCRGSVFAVVVRTAIQVDSFVNDVRVDENCEHDRHQTDWSLWRLHRCCVLSSSDDADPSDIGGTNGILSVSDLSKLPKQTVVEER